MKQRKRSHKLLCLLLSLLIAVTSIPIKAEAAGESVTLYADVSCPTVSNSSGVRRGDYIFVSANIDTSVSSTADDYLENPKVHILLSSDYELWNYRFQSTSWAEHLSGVTQTDFQITPQMADDHNSHSTRKLTAGNYKRITFEFQGNVKPVRQLQGITMEVYVPYRIETLPIVSPLMMISADNMGLASENRRFKIDDWNGDYNVDCIDLDGDGNTTERMVTSVVSQPPKDLSMPNKIYTRVLRAKTDAYGNRLLYADSSFITYTLDEGEVYSNMVLVSNDLPKGESFSSLEIKLSLPRAGRSVPYSGYSLRSNFDGILQSPLDLSGTKLAGSTVEYYYSGNGYSTSFQSAKANQITDIRITVPTSVGFAPDDEVYFPITLKAVRLNRSVAFSGESYVISTVTYDAPSGSGITYGSKEYEAGASSVKVDLDMAGGSITSGAYSMSGDIATTNEPAGTSLDLPDASIVNPPSDQYLFKGWFTGPNGTGTKCTRIDSLGADVKYYAAWEQKVYMYESSPGVWVNTSDFTEAMDNVYEGGCIQLYTDVIFPVEIGRIRQYKFSKNCELRTDGNPRTIHLNGNQFATTPGKMLVLGDETLTIKASETVPDLDDEYIEDDTITADGAIIGIFNSLDSVVYLGRTNIVNADVGIFVAGSVYLGDTKAMHSTRTDFYLCTPSSKLAFTEGLSGSKTFSVTSISADYGKTQISSPFAIDLHSYFENRQTYSGAGRRQVTYGADHKLHLQSVITIKPSGEQVKVKGDEDPVLAYTYTVEPGFTEVTQEFEGALSREAGETVGEYAFDLGDLHVKETTFINARGTFTQNSDDYVLVLSSQSPKFSVIPAGSKYSISYQIGDDVAGSLPPAEEVYEGDNYTLPDIPIHKEGYTFAGWSYNGGIYQAGDLFHMPSNVVEFVATWNRVIPEEEPGEEPAEEPPVEPENTPAVEPENTPAVEPENTPAVVPENTPAVGPEIVPVDEPEDIPAGIPEITPEAKPTNDEAVGDENERDEVDSPIDNENVATVANQFIFVKALDNPLDEVPKTGQPYTNLFQFVMGDIMGEQEEKEERGYKEISK